MKLEVGKFYLSAGGEIVQIQLINKKESMFPYQSVSGCIFMQDGSYFEDEENQQDLISEIPKELHQYIIQTIKDYHTDSDFKATVDSVYGVKQ